MVLLQHGQVLHECCMNRRLPKDRLLMCVATPTCQQVQLHLADSSTKHKVVEGARTAIACKSGNTRAALS